MSISFAASEILIVGGISLLALGMQLPGWIILSAGSLGALVKFSASIEEKKRNIKAVQDFFESLTKNTHKVDLSSLFRQKSENVH